MIDSINENISLIKNRTGFIAALDQSGGSSSKTLEKYGIDIDTYNEEEEFDLIHEMRKRVIESKSFTSDKILATILFYGTMNRKVEGKYTALYLLDEKGIPSFLKIDDGLLAKNDGVSLMKEIPDLEEKLELALKRKIIGTKMRSVIYEANTLGIKKIVEQQFKLANIIYNFGLIPIIEPEVDINSNDKELCEEILKKEIIDKLNNTNIKVIFKLSIPSIDNYYKGIIDHPNTIRVVALSGGYNRDKACQLLSKNNNLIASFSRALLEGLNVNDSDEEFNKKLEESINLIYNASINK